MIGFRLGFLALMRGLVLSELLSPRWDDYLPSSVGMDRVHLGGGRLARRPCGSGGTGSREDLPARVKPEIAGSPASPPLRAVF
ncbi:hypothetical protein [Paracoccus sp. DMF]|uniref:hypothetical protein n=1 Tax=Paracoccus sp. DMF TaxID=400837 RepID=UPI001102C53E|nr:hypothetical protein [Paracoccus sp. DMF]MCV2446099.1 hypothetical protein [Paracoccus sp. DMF]